MRLLLTILTGILCTASAFAQPYIGWVQHFNGLGNSLGDAASAIALDSKSNVYICGRSVGSGGGGIATLKYDPNGNLLWEHLFVGGGVSAEDGAITVDAKGNVYVTDGTQDLTTIKYDSSGNLLWATFYNGPENRSERGRAIAVDVSGNVYVAGVTYDSIVRIDTKNGYYATIKYDSNGNQLWARNYYGPGNGGDGAYDLALDSSGNVYVTGVSSGGASTLSDYATIKYDPQGNELWVACYDGPESGQDAALALALDDSGNVYVTGVSNERRTGFINSNYATVKYDPQGNQLWAARYGEPGDGTDVARDIAIDKNGYIYVTGTSRNGSSPFEQDYATIKYDTQGNQLWVARYTGLSNGGAAAFALALDTNGNIYVTGTSSGIGTNYQDYATIKYDSQGNQLWEVRFDGLANWIDEGHAITVDASGNAYVTGFSSSAIGNTDITTIKYSPNSILKGDLDRSGMLTVDDIVLLLNCVFSGSGDCSPSFSDINCDGILTPLDMVLLLNVYFLSSQPPC